MADERRSSKLMSSSSSALPRRGQRLSILQPRGNTGQRMSIIGLPQNLSRKNIQEVTLGVSLSETESGSFEQLPGVNSIEDTKSVAEQKEIDYQKLLAANTAANIALGDHRLLEKEKEKKEEKEEKDKGELHSNKNNNNNDDTNDTNNNTNNNNKSILKRDIKTAGHNEGADRYSPFKKQIQSADRMKRNMTLLRHSIRTKKGVTNKEDANSRARFCACIHTAGYCVGETHGCFFPGPNSLHYVAMAETEYDMNFTNMYMTPHSDIMEIMTASANKVLDAHEQVQLALESPLPRHIKPTFLKRHTIHNVESALGQRTKRHILGKEVSILVDSHKFVNKFLKIKALDEIEFLMRNATPNSLYRAYEEDKLANEGNGEDGDDYYEFIIQKNMMDRYIEMHSAGNKNKAIDGKQRPATVAGHNNGKQNNGISSSSSSSANQSIAAIRQGLKDLLRPADHRRPLTELQQQRLEWETKQLENFLLEKEEAEKLRIKALHKISQSRMFLRQDADILAPFFGRAGNKFVYDNEQLYLPRFNVHVYFSVNQLRKNSRANSLAAAEINFQKLLESIDAKKEARGDDDDNDNDNDKNNVNKYEDDEREAGQTFSSDSDSDDSKATSISFEDEETEITSNQGEDDAIENDYDLNLQIDDDDLDATKHDLDDPLRVPIPSKSVTSSANVLSPPLPTSMQNMADDKFWWVSVLEDQLPKSFDPHRLDQLVHATLFSSLKELPWKGHQCPKALEMREAKRIHMAMESESMRMKKWHDQQRVYANNAALQEEARFNSWIKAEAKVFKKFTKTERHRVMMRHRKERKFINSCKQEELIRLCKWEEFMSLALLDLMKTQHEERWLKEFETLTTRNEMRRKDCLVTLVDLVVVQILDRSKSTKHLIDKQEAASWLVEKGHEGSLLVEYRKEKFRRIAIQAAEAMNTLTETQNEYERMMGSCDAEVKRLEVAFGNEQIRYDSWEKLQLACMKATEERIEGLLQPSLCIDARQEFEITQKYLGSMKHRIARASKVFRSVHREANNKQFEEFQKKCKHALKIWRNDLKCHLLMYVKAKARAVRRYHEQEQVKLTKFHHQEFKNFKRWWLREHRGLSAELSVEMARVDYVEKDYTLNHQFWEKKRTEMSDILEEETERMTTEWGKRNTLEDIRIRDETKRLQDAEDQEVDNWFSFQKNERKRVDINEKKRSSLVAKHEDHLLDMLPPLIKDLSDAVLYAYNYFKADKKEEDYAEYSTKEIEKLVQIAETNSLKLEQSLELEFGTNDQQSIDSLKDYSKHYEQYISTLGDGRSDFWLEQKNILEEWSEPEMEEIEDSDGNEVAFVRKMIADLIKNLNARLKHDINITLKLGTEKKPRSTSDKFFHVELEKSLLTGNSDTLSQDLHKTYPITSEKDIDDLSKKKIIVDAIIEPEGQFRKGLKSTFERINKERAILYESLINNRFMHLVDECRIARRKKWEYFHERKKTVLENLDKFEKNADSKHIARINGGRTRLEKWREREDRRANMKKNCEQTVLKSSNAYWAESINIDIPAIVKSLEVWKQRKEDIDRVYVEPHTMAKGIYTDMEDKRSAVMKAEEKLLNDYDQIRRDVATDILDKKTEEYKKRISRQTYALDVELKKALEKISKRCDQRQLLYDQEADNVIKSMQNLYDEIDMLDDERKILLINAVEAKGTNLSKLMQDIRKEFSEEKLSSDLKFLRYRAQETKQESTSMLENDFPTFRAKFFGTDVPRLLNRRSECLTKVENLRQKRIALGPKADDVYVEKLQDTFFKEQRIESDSTKRTTESIVDLAKSKTKSYMSTVKRVEAENCEIECELQQKLPYSGDKKNKTIEATFKRYEERENSRLKRLRVLYGAATAEVAKHRKIAERHELVKTEAIIKDVAYSISSQIIDDFVRKKEEKSDYEKRYKQVNSFCSKTITEMYDNLIIAVTEESVPRGKLVDEYSERLRVYYRLKEDSLMATCQAGIDEYLAFMKKNAKDEGKFRMSK